MANNLPDGYFEKLTNSLKNYHRAIPSLLVDLDRLDENIEQFKRNLSPDKDFRIVVKSLPSLPLLRYIMDKMDAANFMVFHQPFLSDLTKTMNYPEAEPSGYRSLLKFNQKSFS